MRGDEKRRALRGQNCGINHHLVLGLRTDIFNSKDPEKQQNSVQEQDSSDVQEQTRKYRHDIYFLPMFS